MYVTIIPSFSFLYFVNIDLMNVIYRGPQNVEYFLLSQSNDWGGHFIFVIWFYLKAIEFWLITIFLKHYLQRPQKDGVLIQLIWPIHLYIEKKSRTLKSILESDDNDWKAFCILFWNPVITPFNPNTKITLLKYCRCYFFFSFLSIRKNREIHWEKVKSSEL